MPYYVVGPEQSALHTLTHFIPVPILKLSSYPHFTDEHTEALKS